MSLAITKSTRTSTSSPGSTRSTPAWAAMIFSAMVMPIVTPPFVEV
jgi:hypothetical protein